MPEVWVVCGAAARVGMKAAMVEAKAWTPEQREVQDALVRRSDPCVVVQGLPGTGKSASVMPPLPETMTSEGGSFRSPKRLKVDSEKMVWWNSGIANPDMFSVRMLPGSVHNCSRIVFEEHVPPAIVNRIEAGVRSVSLRNDLPFGGIQIVVVSSADYCPTQHALYKIFRKNGTVPSVIRLKSPLRCEDRAEDDAWYAFQRAMLHPKPGGLSDNMGRELFYRSSYEAAGSVVLGQKMKRSGKIWYGAATSNAEALRRNLKAVRSMSEPYLVLTPGNTADDEEEDPRRIVVYAGCRVIVRSKLDGHPRGVVGTVYDVTDDSEEESLLVERSGDVLTPKDKAKLWVKFERSGDPVTIAVVKDKKSKVKRWPIACGPCFCVSDWVNQTVERLALCPSRGWTDTSSPEEIVSALQIVVGRVSSFSHFRYDNITVTQLGSCLERVAETWPVHATMTTHDSI